MTVTTESVPGELATSRPLSTRVTIENVIQECIQSRERFLFVRQRGYWP